jgi:hypothetical protein
MGKLSSYAEVTSLAPDDRIPVVTDPGVAGGNAYITAANFGAGFASAASVTPTAWTAVPLVNGWVNLNVGAYGVAAYRKVGDMVQVRGIVASGVGVIATLPAGFRPPVTVLTIQGGSSAFAAPNMVAFSPNGDVSVSYNTSQTNACVWIGPFGFSVTA